MINAEDTHCPRCNAYNPVGATYCLECGYGKPVEEKPRETGRQVVASRCPQCGMEVSPEGTTCANCGAEVAAYAEPKSARACQNCGAASNDKHNFCIYCGARLSQALRTPAFCPRCGARRGKDGRKCPSCGESL